MNRIDNKFKELKAQHKKAFVAFITAGYPNLETTGKLVLEFDRIGVDIVELGVPFSDPMADGPVIQAASQAALKKNVTLGSILNLVKNLRRQSKIPICLMTYYNPIFCFGQEKFIRIAYFCGVDGLIIPDLPPEEGRQLIKYAAKFKIDVVCFIAPTTSLSRIKHIAGISRGFIYYVSLTGTTGARKNLPADIIGRLRLIKKYTKKPICVGFGVSSRSQIAQINKFADGVIVGSAIIRKIEENSESPNLIGRVGRFVSSLKGRHV
jgi:tryptophan synthase alpha chain